LIQSYGLENNIRIFHEAVELFCPAGQGCYDFILFSMSFMLFDDQQAVLKRVIDWLKPDGRLLFFQTMFRHRSFLMDFIKPKLKYFTTVDFGSVTYDDQFYDFLGSNRLSVEKDHFIKREWFRGEYRMIVVNPASPKSWQHPNNCEAPKSAMVSR
jgi:SAM-dependent methyltransferase